MKTVPARFVPPAKLTGYLLCADHPVGGAKAAYFRAFGFSPDRLDIMTAALTAHPDENPVSDVEHSHWGQRYIVRCRIWTPDGRDPCILTVWIVPSGEDRARLFTAYPDAKG
jgi:hypothetical protein